MLSFTGMSTHYVDVSFVCAVSHGTFIMLVPLKLIKLCTLSQCVVAPVRIDHLNSHPSMCDEKKNPLREVSHQEVSDLDLS